MLRWHKNILVEGSEGRPMATDICYREDGTPKTVLIYLHGFNGFKDWGHFDLIATQFAEAGYFFCKFNFSHNGTMPDSPEDFVDLTAYSRNNYSKECEDTHRMIHWLQDPAHSFDSEIQSDRIVLLGHSRGGGIAILSAAAHTSVKGLITWASVAACKTPWATWPEEKMRIWQESGVQYYHNQRTGQDMPLGYQLYEDYLQHAEKLDIQSAMGLLNIPILLCHGIRDTAVPFEKAVLLQSWQPNAELFSVDSDHVFGRKHPWPSETLPDATVAVIQKSLDFLRQHDL